jgi:glucokinase
MSDVIGVDVGGTKLLARVENLAGECTWSKKLETGRDYGPSRLVDDAHALITEAEAAGCGIAALGVGFPGLTDPRRGVVRSSTILNGWCEEPLGERLRNRIGLPCAVDNDVKAAARAELQIRSKKGDYDFLFLAVGTGIGGALIVDGKLALGRGFAGEFGHIVVDPMGSPCSCGRRGCVGLLVGGEHLQRRLGLGAAEFSAALEAGEPEAREVIEQAASLLGEALADALNLLDPGLVVIGGGLGARLIDSFSCDTSARNGTPSRRKIRPSVCPTRPKPAIIT